MKKADLQLSLQVGSVEAAGFHQHLHKYHK